MVAMIIPFAVAGSVLPRVCEWWDSTNLVAWVLVKELKNAQNLEERYVLWNAAIEEIMQHPYKHMVYLGGKIIGDVVLFRALYPKVVVWLKKMFDYIRYLGNVSREYLIAMYPTIRATVLAFSRSSVDLLAAPSAPIQADLVSKIYANLVSIRFGLLTSLREGSTWLYILELLRVLWDIFHNKVAYLLASLSETCEYLATECAKYVIQICGCTLFLFNKLNELYDFCGDKIKLYLPSVNQLFGLNA